VGRTAVKQAVLERFPAGRTAVKQAVLERFPAAHAKLAPSLRCALREDTTAAQGWKDRGTTSQGPGSCPQLMYSHPHERVVGQFREQIGSARVSEDANGARGTANGWLADRMGHLILGKDPPARSKPRCASIPIVI